jgi:hypothetical protein
MKSITIHGVDNPVYELLKSRSREEGLSMNKTIKKLIEESLGVKPQDKHTHRDEFEKFCGIWSRADINGCEKRTGALRKVAPGDWQ